MFLVESFKEIQDSVCVAQRSRDQTEERVILFVKMVPGYELSNELVNNLKSHIRTYLSARHVPAIFLPIADIPVSITLLHISALELKIKQITSSYPT